jgi:hypothetical protein
VVADRYVSLCVRNPSLLGYSQRRAVLIPTSDEQRNTERSRHDALLSLSSLTESQCKITYTLCTALDRKRLGIVEVM